MKPTEIDGRTLEGGGQLVRLTVGLSALTGQAVRITNVRANRASKGRINEGGGLKRQHLTAVKWLAEASSAYTEGVELGSRDFLFDPTRSPHIAFQRFEESKIKLPDGTAARQISIDLGSPGAVSLVLQAILPFLIFSKPAWASTSDGPYPIHLTLEGGTHVTASPSVCYIEQVLIPNLSLVFPHQPSFLSASSKPDPKRGWVIGSPSLGIASFLIHPIPHGSKLQRFNLPTRGRVRRIHLTLIAPAGEGGDILRTTALSSIRDAFPDVEDVVITRDEESGHRFRYYILLVAETENGCRIGRDWLFGGTRGYKWTCKEIADVLVGNVVKCLKEELDSGHSFDRRMMDQIVVFMGLAEGKSTLAPVADNTEFSRDEAGDEKGQPSLHTLTARWVMEKMVRANFLHDGSCEGVGFAAGETR